MTREDRPEDHHRLPPGAAQRPEPAAGRAGPVDQGDVRLTEFEVEAAPADAPGQGREGEDRRATADFNPPSARWSRSSTTRAASAAVTGRSSSPSTARTRPPGASTPARAAATSRARRLRRREAGRAQSGRHVLTFYLKQNHGGWNSDDNQNNNLGRFRLSSPTRRRRRRPAAAGVREILAIPRERAHAGAGRAVFSYWRTTVPEWKEANDRIEALWKQHPEGSSQLVLQQARARAARDARLKRGDFLKPGKAVDAGRAGVPAPAAPEGRPADPADVRPLAGRPRSRRRRPGRSSTASGRRTSAPAWSPRARTSARRASRRAHPELLDWLAVEFMDRGWSLKHLHRLIVTSATYRQSSRVTPELLARPVQPAAGARAAAPRRGRDRPRHRPGGQRAAEPEGRRPERLPAAPAFLFQPPASYGPKVWKEATGPDRYRRALYTFRYRSVPYPVLQTFDAPNGDFSCVRRAARTRRCRR
jgi:hypothetical protein